MMPYPLKQSTAHIMRMGPFLDDGDGKTAETGLSIAQGDIQISKADGAFAQTSNAAPTTTHDTDGWYQVPLTTTDTGTLGPCTVQIAMAGALPVWRECHVLPANVYDSLYSTDKLQVDATQIEGADATDQINAACDTAFSDYDPPTKAEMDAAHTTTDGLITTVDGVVDSILVDTAVIGALGAGLTAVPWNASWDAEVQSECADALTAYDPPTKAEMDAVHATTDALITTVDGIVDTLVARLTAARAGYLDELAAANLPADIDTLLGRITAAVALASVCTEARLAELAAANLPADVDTLLGRITAAVATALALIAKLPVAGAAVAGTLSTTQMSVDLTEVTDDHYNGRLLTWTSGVLIGQQTDITDYDGTSTPKVLTYTAVTEAPSATDEFVIS